MSYDKRVRVQVHGWGIPCDTPHMPRGDDSYDMILPAAGVVFPGVVELDTIDNKGGQRRGRDFRWACCAMDAEASPVKLHIPAHGSRSTGTESRTVWLIDRRVT